MTRPAKRTVGILAGIAVLAAIANSFRPKPVDVDVGEVMLGPMRVSVDQDGRTRVRDRYTVSAPVAGRLERIALDPGDPVKKGQTVLAAIEPAAPALLDARIAEQSATRLQAAKSARARTELEVERAVASFRLASNDLVRARELLAVGGLSRQEFDQAEFTERTSAGNVKSMYHALEIAEFEVEQAQAALSWMDSRSEQGIEPARRVIRSPVDGAVLRVFDKSARTVAPGTPLIEIGNQADLEAVVDVLSEDAVRVEPGARVIFEHWGGPYPLNGRVRYVEPAAFTKLSALGVEEQRVNVIVDMVDVPEKMEQLGDGYRIEARIVTWESAETLTIPAGALFRQGDSWVVFVVEKGRARAKPVSIGHMNGTEAEVLKGLANGDRIIIHPSDTVRDGVAIRIRR